LNKKPACLSKLGAQEARTAYLCLIPAFLGLTFITYLPLLGVFVIGFFRWRGLSPPVFIGLGNYVRLFTADPYFIDSIKVTVTFSLLAVLGSMIYSFVLAMLLNR
jgi:multiple sugar transport system permease protein